MKMKKKNWKQRILMNLTVWGFFYISSAHGCDFVWYTYNIVIFPNK